LPAEKQLQEKCGFLPRSPPSSLPQGSEIADGLSGFSLREKSDSKTDESFLGVMDILF
jgi:hypothetical protein